MIKLHGRLGTRRNADPFVARVARGDVAHPPDPEREIRVVEPGEARPPGYRAYLLARSAGDHPPPEHPDVWPVPESLDHLSDGDIIRISPRSGELWVMYRRASACNSMLLTEQCNSYCLMCSQPPKTGDDRYLVDAYL